MKQSIPLHDASLENNHFSLEKRKAEDSHTCCKAESDLSPPYPHPPPPPGSKTSARGWGPEGTRLCADFPRFIRSEDAEAAAGAGLFLRYKSAVGPRPSCRRHVPSPPPPPAPGYHPLSSGSPPAPASLRERPRKETFPSMIVLPLPDRVMKILGKCYTTRGYPLGPKFPEKPARFPGGDAGGRVTALKIASSAVSPFSARNVSPKIT